MSVNSGPFQHQTITTEIIIMKTLSWLVWGFSIYNWNYPRFRNIKRWERKVWYEANSEKGVEVWRVEERRGKNWRASLLSLAWWDSAERVTALIRIWAALPLLTIPGWVSSVLRCKHQEIPPAIWIIFKPGAWKLPLICPFFQSLIEINICLYDINHNLPSIVKMLQ